jgi:hypothetical protein
MKLLSFIAAAAFACAPTITHAADVVTVESDGDVVLGGRLLMAQPAFGTTHKLSFWDASTDGHSIGLEGWWNVWRAHVNEGWKFKDNFGNDRVLIAGGPALGGSTMELRRPLAIPDEGAQIMWEAAPGFVPWHMDVYQNQFRIFNGATTGQVQKVSFFSHLGGTTELEVQGALIGSSKQFVIDHPMSPEQENLRHIAVEAPRGDLIYRGRVSLKDGRASVNLDEVSNMKGGTFSALTRDPQVFLQNDTGWSSLKGRVRGGRLVIDCEDAASADEVSWMVVAERSDPAYMTSNMVDEHGKFIPEFEKPELPSWSLDPREGVEDGLEPIPEAIGRRGYLRNPGSVDDVESLPKREIRALRKEARQAAKAETTEE